MTIKSSYTCALAIPAGNGYWEQKYVQSHVSVTYCLKLEYIASSNTIGNMLCKVNYAIMVIYL